jgi:dephospho-CoA kinase
MIETNKVVLLFGKICSGKSTYADALCYVTKAKRITVSDIVKRVSGKVSRSELQGTAHMDKEIALELIAEIKKYDKVVIDGIRQYSIVVELVAEFGMDSLDLIWLEVSDDIRKYRFYDRSISKDDITFEEADARDEKLGLKELAESLKDSYIIINN